MHVRNIVGLCTLLAVSYMMYAMQPQAGESSAMGAARGETTPMRRGPAPSLLERTSEEIARQLHDDEIDFDFENVPSNVNARAAAIKDYFARMGSKKSIAEAYCRLYPEAFIRTRAGLSDKLEHVQTIKKERKSSNFSSDGQLLILGGDSEAGWYFEKWRLGEGGPFIFAASIRLPQGWHPQWGGGCNRLTMRSRRQGELADRLHIFNLQNTTKFIGPQILPGALGEPFSVYFSHDGRTFMYSTQEDGTYVVKIWAQDINRAAESVMDNPYQLIQTIPAAQTVAQGAYFGASFGKSNNIVALDGRTGIEIWSRDSGNTQFRKIKEILVASLRSSVLSPDGTLLIAIKDDGKVILFKGDNFSQKEIITDNNSGAEMRISDIQFMPDSSSEFVSLDPLKVWIKDPVSHAFHSILTKPDITKTSVILSAQGYMASSRKNPIDIWRFRPTMEDIWDHIISKYLNPPDIDSSQPRQSSDAAAKVKMRLQPDPDMPALEEPAPAPVQTPARRLQAIAEEKKAIKAQNLPKNQQEAQLNALREEEAELREQCKKEKEGYCVLQ